MSNVETSLRAGPVQAKDRIEFVDILRGFAVLGILVANMASFAGQPREMQAWTATVDRAIWILIRFLVEAKFYSLFSLLFGWGMAVQLMRAESRGANFVRLYMRRLFILLILGLMHSILIWSGDILATYALYGFLLLLFRKRSERVLLPGVVLALLLSIVVTLPGDAMDAFRRWYEGLTAFLRYNRYSESLYATGSYWEITQLRLQQELMGRSWFIFTFGNIFGMFLLGLYIGKRRIFHEVEQHLSLIRRVMWIGLIIGVVFNGIFVLVMVRPTLVPLGYQQLVTRGARTIGAPALMLFYVTGIILLVRSEAWHRRLQPLAAVGRLALSNYLLQSVVCTLLCYSYGLKLYGQIEPLLGLILTIAIYLAQIRLSGWWLERYRFGPMEWVWRTLTYGRIQPFHRRAAQTGRESALGRTARRVTAGIDPRLALVGAWAGLVLWAATLGIWYAQLERKSSPVAIQVPTAEAQATAIPVATLMENPVEPQAEVVATPVVQPVAYRPGPVAASGDLVALASTFSAESALAQIETLTGPPYLGRYTGSPESWAAGDYIADQFDQFGLQPAGDDGTFFQAFPVEYIALATEPRLIVEGADGTVYGDYVLHQDFSTIVRGYSGAGVVQGKVIWVNRCEPDDFNATEVVGKIVFCRSTSLLEASRGAVEHGAAGLLLLTDPEQRLPDFGTTYFEPLVPEPIPAFRIYPEVAEDLLVGSGTSINDLSISFTPLPLEAVARMEVTTTGPEACAVQGCMGRNVLGVLPGRDPAYADEIIVLGAHYDHLGQAPDGTVWRGANDNASGVAVLLEIARSWQEQGFVPRHTVVFAAWDAEEQGLWGAIHYVEHPRYPLEDTVSMIQFDMVGAGGDTLWIDGGGEQGERLLLVAEALGIEAEGTDRGRSDHVPFLMSGIPANLLIWQFDQDEHPQYHRPVDTPAIIELDKLEAAAKIASITVLGLSEGEPAIDALLDRRAEAIEEADLQAFLATSLPEQEAAERHWFADVQTMAPTQFEMRATDIRIMGRTATSRVIITFEQPVEGERDAESRTSALDVKFVHDGDAWLWAGPNLTKVEEQDGFAVAYPQGRDEELAGLGQQAAEQYIQTALLLGVPARADAELSVLPTTEALRVSTALSLPSNQSVWVGPGSIKLAYSPEISTSQQLADALAQLLLADAGLSEATAPWLWQGLPLAVRGETDLIQTHAEYLPALQTALEEDPIEASEATWWAAVDYMRRQVGWQGVGQFITFLGQACREGQCESAQGMDRALQEVLQIDSSTFDASWQGYWRDRMASVQADLDALLAARTEAVLSGGEAAFLGTIDAGASHLVAEERQWFADLARHPLESFSLTGTPLALLADGSFLANVTLDYRLRELEGRWSEATVPLEVLFTPSGESVLWAGYPFDTLHGDGVQVLYPAGQEDMARTILQEAEAIYPQLARDLNTRDADTLTIKLYDDDDEFRTALSLSFPLERWTSDWSGAGTSVKLRLQQDATLEEYRSTLALQSARHLLQQSGVDSEWLLKGVSLYLSGSYDGGAAQRAAAQYLRRLLESIPDRVPYELQAMPPNYELSEEQAGLANAQAWDAIRYLVDTHGWESLAALWQNQAQGISLNSALQNATGQNQQEFEAAWTESLSRAHTPSGWADIANTFDPERANKHVEILASPELGGRQAGSPGAQAAAEYIAGKFAEYGLLPAGDDGTFKQYFPITYTAMISIPRLEIVDEEGRVLESLGYRQDFLTISEPAGGRGLATGELVWVRSGDYSGMELDGKIAVRPSPGTVDAEVALAAEHGAIGLVLAGSKESKKDLLAKAPTPLQFPSENSIPVLELSAEGYTRLLAASGYTRQSLSDAPQAVPLDLWIRMEIAISDPQTVQTANVLGLIPGSDPVLGQEVIILGSHYDHVGDDPQSMDCLPGTSDCEQATSGRYAGANDDASGVGVLLEIARLWRETGYRPRRSVLFAAWGAQELGELGSNYYVEHPALPLEKTVTMLQLDAVGGGGGYYLEAQGGEEREGLLLFSLKAADEWMDGRLAIKDQWERSDQIPFREAGISTLLITWREASEDNWPIEIADEVDPYRLGVAGRIVSLGVMAVAR